MKNQLSFTANSFNEAYNKALNWLNHFNNNQLPINKVRHWKADYINEHLILKF